MTNWQEVKLGDVCSSISETYHGNDTFVVLVNTSDVLEGKILNHELVKNEKLKGQFKKTFKKDDILYSEIRPANKRFAYVDFDDTSNYIASTKLMVLRPNKEKILSKFLFNILKSENIISELQHLAETRSGTFPQITFSSELAPMKILLPPMDIQKKIAGVLGALDDKIELNNKINNNLEQQAQALFKSWFVDFEPFGGTMPKDWKESNIYSISNIIYGAPFASKLFNTEKKGLPIIRIRDLKNQHSDTYTEEIHPKAYIIKAGDIVVGMDGEFRPYIWGNDEGLLNQRVCVFENKRSLGKMFLYLTIKPLLNRVEQTEVATTVIHIGKQDFDAFRFSMPSNSISDKFDAVTQPIYNKIVSNSLENTRLASLRDALLPKLMSGKIDVSNVDISALISTDKLSFRK